MKRKKPDELNIKKFWPLLLWYECEKCKMQFRREWAWKKYFDSINRRRYGTWKYVCSECCSTIEEAHKELTKRPRPPSPPGQSPKPQLPPITVIKEGETGPA